MPPRTTAGKRRGRKEQTSDSSTSIAANSTPADSHLLPDPTHNRHAHPPTRFLADMAHGLLSPNTNEKEDSNASFSALLRQWIANDTTKRIQQSAVATPKSNKKKKRKKKKKKSSTTTSGVTEQVAEDQVEGQPVTVETETNNPPQSPQTPFTGTESQQDTPHLRELSIPTAQERRLDLLHSCLLLLKSNSSLPATSETTASNILQPFCDHLFSGNISCRIPSNTVSSICSAVICPVCRRDLESCFHRIDKKKNHAIIPLSRLNINTDTNEPPSFDYVAMEEGRSKDPMGKYGPLKQQAGWYLAKNEKENEWELCNYSPSTDSENAADSESSPWTVPLLERFFRQGVLLPGIHPDLLLLSNCVNENIDATSKAVMESIRERVHIESTRLEHAFYDMVQSLGVATENFRDGTRDHDAGGNIEMSSFAIMKETDEVCGNVLRTLLDRMMLLNTRSVQALLQRYNVNACSNGEEGETDEQRQKHRRELVRLKISWILPLMDRLWEHYCRGVQEILNACAMYETKKTELANAQGAIPDMFCSAALRTQYRKLVDLKIRVTLKTVNSVKEMLDSPVDIFLSLGGGREWTVSLFEFLTADRLFQQFAKSMPLDTESATATVAVVLPLDKAIEDTLKEVNEWMSTVHQPTLLKITSVHSERQLKLLQMLEDVHKTLLHQQESTTFQSRYLQDLIDCVRHFREDPPNTTGEEVDVVSADFSSFRSNLGNGILRTVAPWLRYKLETTTPTQHAAYIGVQDMPFALRQGVALHRGEEVTATAPLVTECKGGDAQDRMECIFLGLIYRWLDSSYQEWRAHQAEQELLTAFDDDNDVILKVSKKTRKKKSNKMVADVGDTLKNGATSSDSRPSTGFEETNNGTDSDDESSSSNSALPFQPVSSLSRNNGARKSEMKTKSDTTVKKNATTMDISGANTSLVSPVTVSPNPSTDATVATSKDSQSSTETRTTQVQSKDEAAVVKNDTTQQPIQQCSKKGSSNKKVTTEQQQRQRVGVYETTGRWVTAEEYLAQKLQEILKRDNVVYL